MNTEQVLSLFEKWAADKGFPGIMARVVVSDVSLGVAQSSLKISDPDMGVFHITVHVDGQVEAPEFLNAWVPVPIEDSIGRLAKKESRDDGN